MNRKIVAVWMSLAILFGFIVIMDTTMDFIPTAQGITLYVNETGIGAYDKIQDAINASIDGGTVFVYNGTYYENVIVNKSINLIGENKNQTIVDGGGNGNVIYVVKNWVNVTGLTVSNSGFPYAGIRLVSVQNCSIDNINAFNNNGGIFIWDSSYNEVSNGNVSWNNGIGFFLNSKSKNNIIKNNRIISNNADGILFDKSMDNRIICNYISSNNYNGIYMINSRYLNIINNTFINDGIYIAGGSISSYNSHEIPINNSVNNQPLLYYTNSSGVNLDGVPIGQLLIANCTDSEIKNLQINKTDLGIQIAYSSNITILNNNISNNTIGIRLYSMNNSNISSNYLLSNEKEGIYGVDLSYNSLINNNISLNGGYGLELYSASDLNIINNTISSNNLGGLNFYTGSGNNNISGNNVTLNSRDGITISGSSNTLADNHVYSNQEDGIQVRGDFNNLTNNNIVSNSNYGIYIHDSSNTNVTNNSVSYNLDGIYLESSSYVNISNNNLSLNNAAGLELDSSSNNNISDNIFKSNKWHGIAISFSSDENNIISNNFSFNDWNGVSIWASSNNLIAWNYISENDKIGVSILKSSYNYITNNYVKSNIEEGIYIGSWESKENTIVTNTIMENNYGIYISTFTSKDKIYGNNIINNVNQAYDSSPVTYWNEPYPICGNYWSNYSGVDSYKGPNQDILGSDGIGDTPYVIDSDSNDNYPLMAPYEPYKNYTILKPGWNLISIPIIQEEQNLTMVLGTIDGWYDAIQWYNNSDSSDPWKHHKIGKPFGNDLSQLNETMGFWIHITQPRDTIFLYNGSQPTSNQTIQLHSGWNMVGYPSLTSYNRTTGLNNLTFGNHVDAIWSWDAAGQRWEKMGESDHFMIGRGYYIHAKTKCEWEVPL